MKFVKRLIGITLTASAITIMGITTVKAATVTVTSDTLNIREKASGSSKIIAVLSNGAKCDFIEEDGDWYKIKFGSYTGYISKQYSKKNEDTSSESKTETTEKTDDSDKSDNTADKTEDTKKADNSVTTEGETTGKIANDTAVRIVPLIYSSQIGEVKKGDTVTIISEQNNWAYIATSSITGWVRIDSITGKKITQTTVSAAENTTSEQETENTVSENTVVENTVTTDTKTENTMDNTVESSSTSSSYTEKTMYVNDYSVNVRKEASTSSKVMMVLGINTKLTVIGEEGDWYKVKTSEGNGYVSKKLLTGNSPTTSRGGNMLSDHKVSEVSNVTTKSTSSTTSKQTEIVNYAKQFLGVPYVYGGASKSGFDCSGFTMYVYKKIGISMRHGAQAQSKIGTAVNANKKSASSLKENLQPGDLVFFLDYETMDEIGHCGIYIGDGKFIHASSGSGHCVKINSLLPGDYYNTRYCAARRVI